MHGKADLGAGKPHLPADAVNGLIGADVADRQVLEHLAGRGKVLFAGRPGAEEPAVRHVDVGLVDRHVFADQIPYVPHDVFDEFEKAGDRRGRFKAALPLEPHGIGEVMQREKRSDLQGEQLLEHGPIVRHGLVIELVRRRLNAAPLDPKPVFAHTQLGHEGKVLLIALVVLAGKRRIGIVLDHAAVEPVVPAAVGLASLDLRGGGSAPEAHSLL